MPTCKGAYVPNPSTGMYLPLASLMRSVSADIFFFVCVVSPADGNEHAVTEKLTSKPARDKGHEP